MSSSVHWTLPVDEQVVAVPKISSDRVSQRLVERRLPQIAEQLVEVPTVLTPTPDRLADRGAGRRHFSSSWLWRAASSRFLSRTGFKRRFRPQSAFLSGFMEQIVDIPRGGLPGFSPGHCSTTFSSAGRISARTVEQLVDFSSGGLSPGVFSASSAGAADEGLLVVAVV